MKQTRTLFGTVMIGIAMMIVIFIVFTGIIWLLQNFIAYKDMGIEPYMNFFEYVKNIPAPQMFIVVFFGIGLIGLSAKLISMQLKRNFQKFNDAFFQALAKKETIDPSQFRFREFVALSEMVNPLIEKIIFDEKQLQTIIDAQKSLIITRSYNKIINVNRAFLAFFNVDLLDTFLLNHRCISDFFADDEEEYILPVPKGEQWIQYILRNPLSQHKVKIYKKGEPHIFTIEAKVSRLHTLYRVVITLTDISEIEFERKNLIIDATTDPLTKVANRLKFDTLLQQQIELSNRYNHNFCLILLDIDNFKKINDTYGHTTGDQVLETLAKILRKNVRKSDTVARWGGEEFAIILPHTKLVTGSRIAEKLRKKIADANFDAVPRVSCSFGVAEYKRGMDTEQFLHLVDNRLYQAKKSGKNCVVTTTSSP
jgi:diguanylate cyclase (GGDEF)-like protein